MKFIKNLFIILSSAALLTLFSCNNIFDEKDNSEQAYISFSADLQRAAVSATTLDEDDVNKVELTVEKIADDGSLIEVDMDNNSWKSLSDFKNTTLLIDKGFYNFYLNIYAQGVVTYSKLVQTCKIENKEIVAGNNSLLFKTYYVEKGELYLSWQCENSSDNPCPANYAYGTIYKLGDSSNKLKFYLDVQDESDKRIFSFSGEDVAKGNYVINVDFYDKAYNGRQEGANLLYSSHVLAPVNGFKTERRFEIAPEVFENIERSGSDELPELEFNYELNFEDSALREDLPGLSAKLYYLPANSPYVSSIKEYLKDTQVIEGNRKSIKATYIDVYKDEAELISSYTSDDMLKADSIIKIQGQKKSITPANNMKGFFFMLVTYEKDSSDSIECLALPSEDVIFKYNSTESTLISFDLYELNSKSPTDGSITGDNGLVDVSIEASDALVINDASFVICALDDKGQTLLTEEADWTVKLLYSGIDLSAYPDAADYTTEFNAETGELTLAIRKLESAGYYQIYAAVTIDGIVSSKTLDVFIDEE